MVRTRDLLLVIPLVDLRFTWIALSIHGKLNRRNQRL